MTVHSDKNNNQRKPMGFKVQPSSYGKLELISKDLRKILAANNCIDGYRINGKKIFENLLPTYGYDYKVESEAKLRGIAGYTIPEKSLVVLREDIYDGLLEDIPFSCSTVVHELSHIVMRHHITMCRGAQSGGHEFYEDSEWQANSLTAAVMLPLEICQTYCSSPIKLAEVCGTSVEAASYRLNKLAAPKKISIR